MDQIKNKELSKLIAEFHPNIGEVNLDSMNLADEGQTV